MKPCIMLIFCHYNNPFSSKHFEMCIRDRITLSTSGRCISFCRMPNCFLVDVDTRYCHFCGRMGKSDVYKRQVPATLGPVSISRII